jgi:hypothetical protein
MATSSSFARLELRIGRVDPQSYDRGIAKHMATSIGMRPDTRAGRGREVDITGFASPLNRRVQGTLHDEDIQRAIRQVGHL